VRGLTGSTLISRSLIIFLFSWAMAVAASASFSNSTKPYPIDLNPRAMMFVLFTLPTSVNTWASSGSVILNDKFPTNTLVDIAQFDFLSISTKK
jgi:hypothetical protein